MTKTFGKSRLPSRHVSKEPERAPHHSDLCAMGITEVGINAPLVGVARTWNEGASCNISESDTEEVTLTDTIVTLKKILPSGLPTYPLPRIYSEKES